MLPTSTWDRETGTLPHIHVLCRLPVYYATCMVLQTPCEKAMQPGEPYITTPLVKQYSTAATYRPA
jgi:hypothetical protein